MEAAKIYRHSKAGLISQIYTSQKKNSKTREHAPPNYTRQELLLFALSSTNFNRLFNNWVDSKYNKWSTPTFDRKDDYKGYSFKNFNKWMTWDDNKKKGHNDRKNGINNKDSKAVIATHTVTGKVVEFYSMHEADRQTGIKEHHISNCCNKKKLKNSSGCCWIPKSAGGYYWEYKFKLQNIKQ